MKPPENWWLLYLRDRSYPSNFRRWCMGIFGEWQIKIRSRHNEDKFIVVFDHKTAASLAFGLFKCLPTHLYDAVLSAEEQKHPFSQLTIAPLGRC